MEPQNAYTSRAIDSIYAYLADIHGKSHIHHRSISAMSKEERELVRSAASQRNLKKLEMCLEAGRRAHVRNMLKKAIADGDKAAVDKLTSQEHELTRILFEMRQ